MPVGSDLRYQVFQGLRYCGAQSRVSMEKATKAQSPFHTTPTQAHRTCPTRHSKQVLGKRTG